MARNPENSIRAKGVFRTRQDTRIANDLQAKYPKAIEKAIIPKEGNAFERKKALEEQIIKDNPEINPYMAGAIATRLVDGIIRKK